MIINILFFKDIINIKEINKAIYYLYIKLKYNR